MLNKNSITRIVLLMPVSALLVGLLPTSARAVQAHGGLEGLVSHELGHVLFIIGVGFLLFRVFRTKINSPGWNCFKGFLVLILLWNLLTFSGHWLHEFLDPAKIIKDDGRVVGYTVSNFADLLIYLSRLDHLVLVPAFFMLLMALRVWRSQS